LSSLKALLSVYRIENVKISCCVWRLWRDRLEKPLDITYGLYTDDCRIGWSFVNEILSDYPKKNTWKQVHALSNRPLAPHQTLWPEDSRLNMVPSIDLLAHSQESLEIELAEKLPHIDEVTHVYYLAYKAGLDVQKELEEAVEMFSKAVKAMDKLCPALEYVVLQIGTKVCKTYLIPAKMPGMVELT
jgi:hypothetical protein